MSLCSATGADQGSKAGRHSLIDDVQSDATMLYFIIQLSVSVPPSLLLVFYSLEFCSSVCLF